MTNLPGIGSELFTALVKWNEARTYFHFSFFNVGYLLVYSLPGYCQGIEILCLGADSEGDFSGPDWCRSRSLCSRCSPCQSRLWRRQPEINIFVIQ